ncbi:hypothetical protein J3A83DRAFT_4359123 [Scleroderma citrinum]
MISGQEVEMFCGVVGNQNEAYKLDCMGAIKAPMDFTIVASWQETIMRAIFPPAINGGFLKLLHLAEPLEAGDTCITDACISSVKNTNAGKAVQVKGHVFCDSPTIIRVTSSFLYHSCFTNFKNTFETIDEPDYVVKLLDDTTEWLAWEAESQLVKAGVTLVFHICFQVIFKDKTSYCNVCATRDVFLHDQLKHLKKVGCPKGDQWCQRFWINRQH